MKVPDSAPTPLPDAWSRRLAAASGLREEASLQRRIHPPTGLDFCSNDYLGLRQDPRLARAAAEAADAHGTGSGAARLLRGTTPLHDALEAALADWSGHISALLFGTGYQANATLLPALAREGDAVFSDALNHASLVDGCRLAKAGGARIEVYRHGDLEDLEARLVAWHRARPAGSLAVVATEAVFSMDGDAADLSGLSALCAGRDALLLVDEAHALGLLGHDGGGLVAERLGPGGVPLVVGTLGKALGCQGAYAACGPELREHLVNTARGFLFSTSLPPPTVGAAGTAVALAREERWRAERALGHAARLRQGLGLPPSPSAIVPVVLGSEARALASAAALQARGFDVRAVRPPTVPPGTSRLRITTAAHQSDADVEALLAALGEVL